MWRHAMWGGCGSGTVLIEARVRGFEAMGVDLNPLAVRLSRVKSDALTHDRREQLWLLATELRGASEARVQARDNVRAELPPTELPADQLVEELAEDAQLEPVAIASQERPDFRGGPRAAST